MTLHLSDSKPIAVKAQKKNQTRHQKITKNECLVAVRCEPTPETYKIHLDPNLRGYHIGTRRSVLPLRPSRLHTPTPRSVTDVL